MRLKNKAGEEKDFIFFSSFYLLIGFLNDLARLEIYRNFNRSLIKGGIEILKGVFECGWKSHILKELLKEGRANKSYSSF